ncbi:hypothetical protein PVAND_005907 [Polypedilum vanderplanki]|uniref:Zinc phosphodiesterase ELAC protein 2 n=1 Tax=Polypedilum vanderplanki TaxID=319348 RepID=A0A9J6C2F6_POLVA|nr:hypothetical protein PVAND_005907 [Polypedilum vanderplanki]
MPKDTTDHIQNNQKHRIRIKEKSKFYSPGTVNIQVLGSGARGTSSSIYLFSEQSRYLFNCGEGTQRLAHEHHTKLTRMEHIFLTQKTWDKTGGLPGLCLTLQEIGVPALKLHGPSGLEDIFDATKKFCVLRNMKVDTPECNDGDYWEDSVMRVNYVPLYKPKSDNINRKPALNEENNKKSSFIDDWNEKDVEKFNKIQVSVEETNKNDTSETSYNKELEYEDTTDYYGYEDKNRGFKKYNPNREQSSTSTYKSKKVSLCDDHVMAYICKLQPKPGTLDLEKCVDAGVRPGPLLGHLKNGIDVTLPDGTIVKADDVRGPSCPGPVFIFIDIPSEEYLPVLLNCERFKPYQSGAEKEEDVAKVVVHFTSEEIMATSSYKEWMDRFSPSTFHFLINERNSFTGYFASHRIQRQLHEIDKNVFPMLLEPHPFTENTDMALDISEIEAASPAKKFKVDIMPREHEIEDKYSSFPELGVRSCFHLRPPKGFDRYKEPYSHPDMVMEETYVNAPDLPPLIEEFKRKSSAIVTRTKAERNKEFPKVITFGTGSCIPNKTRNVSANLIQISNDNCAIFDCGEGTLGQLVRYFGRDGADDILRNLSFIYVSHLHADHHLGLINLLNRRRKITKNKVVLLAPNQINAWLSFYNRRIEEIASTYELFPCSDLLGWNVEEEKIEALLKRLGLEAIQTCFVKHCPHSYGISITMKNQMQSEKNPRDTVKITYSGDTIPCDELIEIGKDSDILIHEATMEDDLWKEARIKMHSTVSQAIDVGKKMRARYVILTHFSQRYAKIPLMEKNFENVAIAFDNMEVTLNDLPMMYLMYEPLKVMFADHYEQMEEKKDRRRDANKRKIQVNMPNGNEHNTKKRFSNDDQD